MGKDKRWNTRQNMIGDGWSFVFQRRLWFQWWLRIWFCGKTNDDCDNAIASSNEVVFADQVVAYDFSVTRWMRFHRSFLLHFFYFLALPLTSFIFWGLNGCDVAAVFCSFLLELFLFQTVYPFSQFLLLLIVEKMDECLIDIC